MHKNPQDMESPAGYHLFATENSSTNPAIKGHNNNSSGTAIHSDGKLKVDGQVIVDASSLGQTSVSITSSSGNTYGLDVAGKVRVTKDCPATALQVINHDESASGFALHATGKVLADYTGDGDAVKIIHSDPTELALNVDGMARIRKTTASAYSILEVINDGEGGSIHADGKLQVDGDSDLNGRAVGADLRVRPIAGSGAHIGAPLQDYFPAGTHQITFDGSDLPSGIYLARLTAGDWSAVQKLVLMK